MRRLMLGLTMTAGLLLCSHAAHSQRRLTPPQKEVGEPIHQAATRGDVEAIKAELEAGVDVNLPMEARERWLRGATPLMMAAGRCPNGKLAAGGGGGHSRPERRGNQRPDLGRGLR